MLKLNQLSISGKKVLPIIEGGKGINVSTGLTAGSFAKAGAVGTVSGTNADYYDNNGNWVKYYYEPNATRVERFRSLVKYSILGGVAQLKIANDVAMGAGRIHLNLLWEAGGTREILHGILDQAKDLVHGITCGAGLPYALSEIAKQYNKYYYPIISSARAFKILWKRAYKDAAELLGGVVYEDPWLAGGHNGLSNQEDPKINQDPYPRIVEIRKSLDEINMQHVPIIIAGGVWNLQDWSKYLDNPEVGLVSFQFGTRPLLTQESPIPMAWKKLFSTLKDGDISLHRFSPTGFYSSAIRNKFLKDLESRLSTEMMATRKPEDIYTKEIPSGNGVSVLYVSEADYTRAIDYINQGLTQTMRTPDKTIIFVEPTVAEQIKQDQVGCMGCLSACRFSGWSDHNPEHSTGLLPDPRSFCIEKTLQDIGHGGSIEDNLLFSGHHAYKFASDPFYANGYIPTIAELVEAIKTGK
jgi:NAD(P)H-dependent flavin oxidoreductase YrpB (nitropropane dioxygenase family)